MLKGILGMILVSITLIFLLAQPSAMALRIEAPTDVNIKSDSTSFLVTIYNDSIYQKDLKVSFFSAAETDVLAPISVPGNTSVTAKIIVKNNYENAVKVSSLVEARLGEEIDSKEVILSFAPTSNEEAGALGAFFSLGTFTGELSKFTLLEWGVFIFLVLIAAVLVIAFVARLARRV